MKNNHAKDSYMLRRDRAASIRLNAQHGLWVDTFGWILHPKVQSVLANRDDAQVADVGSGTGIAVLQLSSSLVKQPKALIGMDISADQYPRASWLPRNVELLVVDALDPNGPPKEFEGRFDVVHVRYLLSLVKDNDPSLLIHFFHKLLKPGGYLQWGEPRSSELNVKQADESHSTPGLDTLVAVIRKMVPFVWIEDLPSTLTQRGFEICDVDRKEAKPWQREWYKDSWLGVMEESQRVEGPSTEMLQQVCKESNGGSWVEFQFQCVVARKLAL